MNPVRTLYSRRAAVVALGLLLFLLLAACGRDETPADATVAAPAATTAPDTAAPATTAPTTAAVAEATAAPPTAEPALQPTPTLAAAAETAAGDCGHEYFPVVEGRVMRYTNDVPGLGTTEFAQTTGDVTDSSFTVSTDVGEGEALVLTWNCLADGLLAPELSQLPGAEGITIEYTEASGITIPSADRFRPGETWSTHYVATATLGEGDAGGMTMVETIDMDNEVVGVEAVSVAAGEFAQAVRVETTGNVNIAMTIDGATQPASDVPMSFTSWYVAGVGLVRQEFSGLLDGGALVTELVAVEE